MEIICLIAILAGCATVGIYGAKALDLLFKEGCFNGKE